MKKTHKLTMTAMLIAIGTISSNLVSIPIGFTRVFPVQHFLNVLSAVLLGPYYAVAQALCVSLIRNLMGTGSIFAFPGSMVGALLASLLFLKTRKIYLAFLGEVIGTGILGALLCYPIATLILGQKATLFGFIPLFIFSSFAGALLGFVILTIFIRKNVVMMGESKAKIMKIK
ncbi:energy coupling factor transporter S component ThiW [Neobacillus jeddahensis]|uniref:energy coupling factor transporter S component ThiW n=1 Tax=Neobacillus jeddahensis TaxID=1461580 RepID=UPI00059020F0|nr:energy coupling factor transporter S component ThiW [Neobacillus jeddahensis]